MRALKQLRTFWSICLKFARTYRHATEGSAFAEFAIMIPTVMTVVVASSEFSHTTNRHAHFALCTYSASTTFSSLGIAKISPEFNAVNQALNACLDNMASTSRVRILCYKRPSVIDSNGNNLVLEWSYDALEGRNISNQSPLNPRFWQAPSIPKDHFGFDDGACVTQGCLDAAPLNRNVLVLGDVMSRLFSTFDSEYCTSNWAKSNRVKVITDDNVKNAAKQSFNEILDL